MTSLGADGSVAPSRDGSDGLHPQPSSRRSEAPAPADDGRAARRPRRGRARGVRARGGGAAARAARAGAPAPGRPRALSAYVAIRGELDPAGALEAARAAGFVVALPRIDTRWPPRLRFHRVDGHGRSRRRPARAHRAARVVSRGARRGHRRHARARAWPSTPRAGGSATAAATTTARAASCASAAPPRGPRGCMIGFAYDFQVVDDLSGRRARRRRRPRRHGAPRARRARGGPRMIPTIVAAALVVVPFVIALFVGRALRPPSLPQSDAEKQRLLEAAKAEAESLKRQAVLEAKELAQKARADVEAELKARQGDLEQRGGELGERERELDKRERATTQQNDEVARATQAARGPRGGRRGRGARGGAAGHGGARAARAHRGPVAGRGQGRARRRGARRGAPRRWPTRSRRSRTRRAPRPRRSRSASSRHRHPALRRRVRRRAHRVDGAAAVRRHEGAHHRARGAQHPRARGGHRHRPHHRRHARGGHHLAASTRCGARSRARAHAPHRRRAHPPDAHRGDGREGHDEVEAQCKEAGEQAVFDLGPAQAAPRARAAARQAQAALVGRAEPAAALDRGGLHRGHHGRPSWGCNVKMARRAGLLHDIGKAIDQEVEGAHAVVGAALARKFNESPQVVRTPSTRTTATSRTPTCMDHLVDAANVLSGQRPGARRELLESYVQRLADLERIADELRRRASAPSPSRPGARCASSSRTRGHRRAGARCSSKDIARSGRGRADLPGPGAGRRHPRDALDRLRQVGASRRLACAGGDEGGGESRRKMAPPWRLPCRSRSAT